MRRPRRLLSILAALGLVGLLLAGCSSSDGSDEGSADTEVTADETSADEELDPDVVDEDTEADDAVSDVVARRAKGGRTTATFDVTTTLASIQQFWTLHAQDAGLKRYTPLPKSRLRAYGSGAIYCDGDAIAYEDVEDNAFATVCDEGDTIVWDPAMFDDLVASYGPVGPALVLAHEWGHVIMYQAGVDLPGVVAEQYADCMAGAYVAWAIDGEVAPFDQPSALDATISSTAEFSDTPGDDANDEDAHGLAFDRIRAFQEGYEGSPKRCVDYEKNPPSLTEVPFDRTDSQTGGNLGFKETLQLATATLKTFEKLQPTLVNVAGMVALTGDDLAYVKDLHQRIGDSSTFVVRVLDASAAAQENAGEDPEEEGPLLQQACVTGAYLGWLADGGSKDASMSPGDLDEAVATFVDLTDPTAEGFLFEQIAQLRVGFEQGPTACTLPNR